MSETGMSETGMREAPTNGPGIDETRFGLLPDLTPSSIVSCFTMSLAAGQIMATRCGSCQREYLPPRGGCVCGKASMEWRAVEPRGKLVSFCEVHYAPGGLEASEPYTVVIVELEGGLRLTGWWAEDRGGSSVSQAPQLAMVVEVIPRRLAGGAWTLEAVPLEGVIDDQAKGRNTH